MCPIPPDTRKVTTEEPSPSPSQVHLEVAGYGETGDPLVVLIPALGRGADDFDDLGQRLAAAGFFVLCPNPRGVGGSTGPLENLNIYDHAHDIAVIISEMPGAAAHVVGHAFGNIVARALATEWPGAVRSLALLAAGGEVPGEKEANRALLRCYQLDLPQHERIEAIRTAFFAAGNDPSVWAQGWWPEVKDAQLAALAATDRERFRDGGAADILVIQGLDDRLAPPENGRRLEERLGDRVELVELPSAGHALLPEQPRRIAEVLIHFLKSFD